MRTYDPEIGEQLIALVADGKGLKGASLQLGIPRRSARAWESAVPAFATALAAARREALDDLAEEIRSISDEVEGCTDTAVVMAARLRVDSRKWLLSKLRPERYGDRVAVTGTDGRDLFPPSPEAQIPRLMAILSVLLPGSDNSQLHQLATSMARKMGQIEGPGANGRDEDVDGARD